MQRATAVALALSAVLTGCSAEPIGKVVDQTPASSTTDPDGATTEPASESTPSTPAFAQDLTNRGSSRRLPLPIDGEVRIGTWDVKVVAYDPDATAEILAFNEGNQPPPPGRVLAVARIEATYAGPDESANAFLNLEWALVDDAGELWTDADCGVLPDDLASQSGVPNGATATGTICFGVPEALLDQVVLHIAPLLGPEPTRRWWIAPAGGVGKVFSGSPDTSGAP